MFWREAGSMGVPRERRRRSKEVGPSGLPNTQIPQLHLPPPPLPPFIPADSGGLLIHSASTQIGILATFPRKPGVARTTQSWTPTYEHAVFVWVPSIFNNRNDVGPLLGQVNEVTARAVGELNCID